MADDTVVFALHRAVVVRDAGPATKGYRYRTRMGDAMDSPTAFMVRHASDDEAKESAQKLKDEVAARVEHLQMEAKIAARVAELRHEIAITRRVEELRREYRP